LHLFASKQRTPSFVILLQTFRFKTFFRYFASIFFASKHFFRYFALTFLLQKTFFAFVDCFAKHLKNQYCGAGAAMRCGSRSDSSGYKLDAKHE
jgi:hypothetical protein